MIAQGTSWTSGHVHPGKGASLTVSRVGERVHVVHSGGTPAGWLAELAGRLVPARPNEVAVVVGVPLVGDGIEGLCRQLVPVLAASRDTHVRLLVLTMSGGAHESGGQPSAAQLICERWGLDVLATAGVALVTSDGCLFSPDLPEASGGWWHFSRAAAPRRVGSYLPVPSWAAATRRVGRQMVAGHVVEPVPAGLAVRPAGPAPVAAHTRPHAVVPERDRPQLILASSHVPAAALAVVVTSLPKSVRGVLRLASLDGRSLCGRDRSWQICWEARSKWQWDRQQRSTETRRLVAWQVKPPLSCGWWMPPAGRGGLSLKPSCARRTLTALMDSRAWRSRECPRRCAAIPDPQHWHLASGWSSLPQRACGLGRVTASRQSSPCVGSLHQKRLTST